MILCDNAAHNSGSIPRDTVNIGSTSPAHVSKEAPLVAELYRELVGGNRLVGPEPFAKLTQAQY